MFGITPKSRVQFIMSYGLFSGAMLNSYAIQQAGGFVLPAGIQPTAKQFELMRDFKIDTLVATPGYYLHLYDYAHEHNIDLSTLSLKRGIAAGEVYTERLRKEIERKLGVVIYDHYGLCEVNTGIAYECEYHAGLHVLDDYVIAEVIDPISEEPVLPGVEGELVLTSLRKEASPIIRYKTGDITKRLDSMCPCGRLSVRIARIQGRLDDMMFIKGIKVNPYELKDLIIELAEDRIFNDIKIITRRNVIHHTPKILVTLRDSKDEDTILRLRDLLKERTCLRFEVEHVGHDYFKRDISTKVKLVEYVNS